MGSGPLEEWVSRHVKSMPLASLKNSVIGIDAIYYLERLLLPSKEPLLSAIGGSPLALGATIARELEDLKSAGIKPHFVFNGLDYGAKEDIFTKSIIASEANAGAFKIYEEDRATEAITIFKKSGIPDAASLADFLKKVLYNCQIEFTVAPFSALAQLAYYDKDSRQFIDAIYGPSEAFLYGVDKVITELEIKYVSLEISEGGIAKKHTKFVLEESRFSWIDRRICIEDLGHIPVQTFIDACLIAGSRLLSRFPPLPALHTKRYTFQDVVNLITNTGRSVASVCAQYQDDPLMKELDYLDSYKKAAVDVKHHVIITTDGNVETLDAKHAPSDVHDCIGQRLPEELDMYLSRGLIRSRVLTWLTTGKILIPAPWEGGNSIEFQNLMKVQLDSWRRQALCLLADSVHRYYQRKEVTTKVWFDSQYEGKFNIKDLLPSPRDKLHSWCVREDLILERQLRLGATEPETFPGSLYKSVRYLKDSSFASRTISVKRTGEDPLQSTVEITANVIWRFLQLRGYVDENHQLTTWGSILYETFSALGPERDLEEAAFLAIELLRLNLLNPHTMFLEYSGAPSRGTETDRRNCMLVSRVASLGKLRHQPVGYTGPLSRHLLAYQSMTSAVHASLRDLIEMSLATMFLDGMVDREREDWMDLSLGLPFYNANSCALGIATKTYLDELCTMDDPTSIEVRDTMKGKCQIWLKFSDFTGSLDDAFKLWDSVYKGVTFAKGMVNDQNVWKEVDVWLSQRR